MTNTVALKVDVSVDMCVEPLVATTSQVASDFMIVPLTCHHTVYTGLNLLHLENLQLSLDKFVCDKQTGDVNIHTNLNHSSKKLLKEFCTRNRYIANASAIP